MVALTIIGSAHGRYYRTVRLDEEVFSLLFEAGIEGVAQAVADEIDREHRQEDEHTGHDDHAARAVDVQEALRVGEHVAPGCGGRLHAETEVGERGLDKDDVANLQGGGDDQGRGGIGQDVAQNDAPVAGADHAGGLDVVAHPNGQEL